MVKRIGSSRRKTRHIFTKPLRKKGKISFARYMQSFKEGEKVLLNIEPSVHHGQFFRRFIGKIGIIKRKNGSCYEVFVNDHGKKKVLISHPIHLRRV